MIGSSLMQVFNEESEVTEFLFSQPCYKSRQKKAEIETEIK